MFFAWLADCFSHLLKNPGARRARGTGQSAAYILARSLLVASRSTVSASKSTITP